MHQHSVVCLLVMLATSKFAVVSGMDPETMAEKTRTWAATEANRAAQPEQRMSKHTCIGGKAGRYPCKGIDMLSLVPLSEFRTRMANDVWGWRDNKTGKEYALLGLKNGLGFIDVSVPENPEVLGTMKSTKDSSWHDMKVYKDAVFHVEDHGVDGLQIFDLTRLRNKVSRFTPDVEYKEQNLRGAHNVAINEETGVLYIVGSNTCRKGIHMVDVNVPKQPKFLGCVSDGDYCHDVQCVIYRGPDKEHAGKEICFAYNEKKLTIVDVSDKKNPQTLSRTPYSKLAYSHQGWLDEKHEFLFLGDELDEKQRKVSRTRTVMWDVRDLDNPLNFKDYYSRNKGIDHNMYVKGDRLYQSNYADGLQVLSIEHSGTGEVDLKESAYFDVEPDINGVSFEGSWSVYPYLPSGNILLTGVHRGLFVLRMQSEGTGTPTTSCSNKAPQALSQYCDSWKDNNFCTKGQYVAWMQANCALSCNTCNLASLGAATRMQQPPVPVSHACLRVVFPFALILSLLATIKTQGL
jgi:choice-of-anchor B domain-containing protein